MPVNTVCLMRTCCTRRRTRSQNAIAEVGQGDRVLLIGAGHDGTLLEVVVLGPDTDPVLIHAMKLRPKFYAYLPGGR